MSLKLIMSIGLLFSPLLSWIRLVHAKIQKIILPKDTPREDLAYQNPAELDTHNLNLTPLQDFKTMGITDHQTDLDTWRLEISGHVKMPLHLKYSEILALPKIERDVLSNKVFLAYEVNGKALPQKHGFPLRIVAEGHFGFTWVKYVHKITVN
jgi:DMSO/TMAO reductase YedYZ molybdopterin-dependent catalytic subunit